MGQKTKITEKELKLILTLKEGGRFNKKDLLKKVWNYNDNLESHAFETHLHRLRKKMERIFNDKKFINEEKSFYFF
jgi:DNA-binding response OmpR family regulator